MRGNRIRAGLRLLVTSAALAATAAQPASAHVRDPQDEILKAIGIDEKLGAPVPSVSRSGTRTGPPCASGTSSPGGRRSSRSTTTRARCSARSP